MPFHVGGFLEDIDSAAAFANLAALADSRLFTQGDDLRVPSLNRIILIAGGADGVVDPRIRLTSPTLDEFTRYEVTPLNVQNAAAVEPGSPQAVVNLLDNPLTLGVDEILQCELNNNPAVAQDQWCLLWFADEVPQPLAGAGIFTVRATGTATLTANVWTQANITLDENLPPGDYAIVGMRASAAGLIAARVVFRTGEQWRPGCLGVDANADIQDSVFRGGRLGVWGTFPFTQIPAIEYLSVSADTAQVVHLDLVRL